MEKRIISFLVDGTPVPKQSFRYVRGGGYIPLRVKNWQSLVSIAAREAMNGSDLISGPVSVSIVFCLKTERRCDLDNLSKGTLDAMRGIVYRDDSQVVALHLVKHIKKNPGALIYVQEAEP